MDFLETQFVIYSLLNKNKLHKVIKPFANAMSMLVPHLITIFRNRLRLKK